MPKLSSKSKRKTGKVLPSNPVLRLRILRESGEPITLRVNDQVTLQVEDDKSFQLLLELVDRVGVLEAVREGLKEAEEGKCIPWEQAKKELARKYGVSTGDHPASPARD